MSLQNTELGWPASPPIASAHGCGKLDRRAILRFENVKLSVVEGGRGAASMGQAPEPRAGQVSADEVMAEAGRRLRAIGYDSWRVRSFMSGTTMPAAVHYLAMQINFTAEALSRLEPVPSDFRRDAYWPSVE